MSYYEAIRDGVPHSQDKNGDGAYYPPCSICGCAVYSMSYVPGTRYVCKECRKELVKQELDRRSSSSASIKETRLAVALKRIAKVADVSKYDEAVVKVRRGFSKPQYYQSTEEIMVALELLRHKIKVYHQVKIYDYRVDFVLPDYRVALEIDGELYHPKERTKQSEIRDEAIVGKLGEGWEIIHIKASNINLNVTRLLPALKAVIARRKSQHTNAHEST